jgi:outer membrane biosynthesis protein TonB
LGAGLLSACANHPPPPPAKVEALAPPPPPLPVPPRPRPIPVPEHKPTPPPEPGAQAPEEAAAASLPPPPAALPAPPAQPKELIGLDQRKAVRLFGTATEKSEQPPAMVWRWRSGTCELDLYFYLDLRSGQMRSLHYVFKGDATGQEDCLRSLAVATRG